MTKAGSIRFKSSPLLFKSSETPDFVLAEDFLASLTACLIDIDAKKPQKYKHASFREDARTDLTYFERDNKSHCIIVYPLDDANDENFKSNSWLCRINQKSKKVIFNEEKIKTSEDDYTLLNNNQELLFHKYIYTGSNIRYNCKYELFFNDLRDSINKQKTNSNNSFSAEIKDEGKVIHIYIPKNEADDAISFVIKLSENNELLLSFDTTESEEQVFFKNFDAIKVIFFNIQNCTETQLKNIDFFKEILQHPNGPFVQAATLADDVYNSTRTLTRSACHTCTLV